MLSGRNLSASVLLVAAAAVSQTSLHAQSAFIGDWRLDRSASHFRGTSITIGRTPTGYHFDFGAVSFDVGDDGADYPTVPSRTTSIRPLGKGRWFRVHKTNGAEVDHSTLTLTPDNAKLQIHTVSTAPDGSRHIEDETMRRVGAGKGLAGTWRSEKAGVNVSSRILIEPAGEDQLRWSFPDEGQFYMVRLNDQQAPLQGPRSVPGVTIRFHAVSPSRLTWVELVNGKPDATGTDELLNNHTLKEVTTPAQNPSDSQEAIYRKR